MLIGLISFLSRRIPPPTLVGITAMRPISAGDHRHSASQLVRLVLSGSTGGARGRGLPGEVRWRASPHSRQRTLWCSAVVGVQQDARWDRGQSGGRRWGRCEVFESQAVLQSTGHRGVSEGRSYLLAGVDSDIVDTRWYRKGQELTGRLGRKEQPAARHDKTRAEEVRRQDERRGNLLWGRGDDEETTKWCEWKDRTQ